jgi:hypothetical protein
MYKLLLLILTFLYSCGDSSAQNWRQENPDAPNGYRASEYASHYHGDACLPANEQNGYRASEARSHYGGGRFETSPETPSNRWESSNTSENRSQDSSSFWDRRRYRLLSTARQMPNSGDGQALSEYGSLLQQTRQTRQSREQSVLQNGGGFNHLYVGN